jgi:large subunit ribosomal protein L18
MARGASYNIKFRRRREGKTNYKLRKRLIVSGLPRIVVRKTLKHVIVQLSEPKVDGDIILVSAHSKELIKYGWMGNFNNIPGCYLTGLLCGFRSIEKGVRKAVLDIGLQSPSQGGRIFAALKGIIDAGVNIPHKEDILPSEERILGNHISRYAKELSSKSEEGSHFFSKYILKGLNPQDLPSHFSSVRKRLMLKINKSDSNK